MSLMKKLQLFIMQRGSTACQTAATMRWRQDLNPGLLTPNSIISYSSTVYQTLPTLMTYSHKEKMQ